MYLSVFSDELGLDYRQALPIIAGWGFKYVDFRAMVNRKGIEFQTKEELLELKEFLKRHGLSAGVLQTSLAKVHLPDNERVEAEKKKLEGIILAAEILECNRVRSFNFWQPSRSVLADASLSEKQFQMSLEMYAPFAETAAKAGLVVGFENCGQSPADVKKALEFFGGIKGWGMAWDPYNQYEQGKPEKEAENDMIAECLSYTNMIHVKAQSIIPQIIKGRAPWGKILRAATALDKDIPVSVETHNPAGSPHTSIDATKTTYYMIQDVWSDKKYSSIREGIAEEPFTRAYADNPVRYVVVGLGMGSLRARQITETSGTQLVGVCDLLEDKAKKIGEELGVRYSTDINDFLSDSNVEAMYIVTPTGTHCEEAIKCMNAGKHVLVTKPMDVTAENCRKAIELAKSKGLLFGLDFDTRITTRYLELKKAVDKGWFGRLISMTSRLFTNRTDEYFKENGGWRGTWAMDGGGSLANQGIHEIDHIYSLLGMPERICASAKTLEHAIETEDSGMTQWEYANGTVASFYSTTCHPSGGWHVRVEIVGTKGAYTYISGGAEGTHIYWCDDSGKWFERAPYPQKQLFRQGSDAFAYSLRTGEPLLVSAEDGLMSRILLDCMYESAHKRHGNWVNISDMMK